MPSNIPIITTIQPLLITAALVFICGIPRALALPQHIDNVLSLSRTLACKFEFAGYAFDLCPLADLVVDLDLAASNVDLQNGGDNFGATQGSTRKLKLALPFSRHGHSHGALEPSPSLPGALDNQCLENDWVCVSDAPGNIGDEKISPSSWKVIAGPGLHAVHLSSSGDLSSYSDRQNWDVDKHALSLTFVPNSYAHLDHKIHFICDIGATVSTTRIRVDRNSKSGAYIIGWHTPHACPAATGAKHQLDIDELRIVSDHTITALAEGEEGGSDGEANGEEGSLRPPKPRKISRRWIAVLLSVLGVVAMSVFIVRSSPRIRHFVLEKLSTLSSALSPYASRVVESLGPMKRALAFLTPASLSTFAFRQGDSQLVRWAEEDMALEEDFMVNGSGAYELDGEDWNGRNLDEYIPLTISPKWGRRVRSYGATPLSATFPTSKIRQ